MMFVSLTVFTQTERSRSKFTLVATFANTPNATHTITPPVISQAHLQLDEAPVPKFPCVVSPSESTLSDSQSVLRIFHVRAFPLLLRRFAVVV